MNLLFHANNILVSGSIADKSNSNSWPSFFQTMVQLFSLIFILGFVIILIYFFARMMTKLRVGVGGENIKVIEYKNIGMQNNLILVQVSSRYFLLSSSKDKVNFIAELDSGDIDKIPEPNEVDFKGIFNSYFNKNKNEVD